MGIQGVQKLKVLPSSLGLIFLARCGKEREKKHERKKNGRDTPRFNAENPHRNIVRNRSAFSYPGDIRADLFGRFSCLGSRSVQ
jgi:hypothetical protein